MIKVKNQRGKNRSHVDYRGKLMKTKFLFFNGCFNTFFFNNIILFKYRQQYIFLSQFDANAKIPKSNVTFY